MDFSQKDIVYIKFPFTDLSTIKLRPALIISNQNYNKKDNIILVGIFGNKGIKEYSIELNSDDLIDGKMLKKSYFRFQNIFSLDKNLIHRKIGILNNSKFEDVITKFDSYIK